jgi:hypothetical protein
LALCCGSEALQTVVFSEREQGFAKLFWFVLLGRFDGRQLLLEPVGLGLGNAFDVTLA